MMGGAAVAASKALASARELLDMRGESERRKSSPEAKAKARK